MNGFLNSRIKFYCLLFLLQTISFALAWYFFELLAPIALFSGASLFYFVHVYEKMLREKVAFLVKNKVETLGASSHEQTARLKHLLDETKRNYEHQIDLLQSSAGKTKERIVELELEMEKRSEEGAEFRLEFEDLKQEYKLLQQERDAVSKEFKEQLSHKEGLITEYQQTIHEQRAIIEKKQRYIGKLEGKVHDLMYEIRSLLQLDAREEIPLQTYPEQKEDFTKYLLPSRKAPVEITTQYDLALILQKYLTDTEKFPSFGMKDGKSRFLDLPLENYAINQRQLFDSLRDETCAIVFVYSQMEGKLLFMNSHAKTLLGWSPEKVIKDFGTLAEDLEPFHHALRLLQRQREASCEISLKDKYGVAIDFKCLMGAIFEGPFQHHVIGLLSPLESIV